MKRQQALVMAVMWMAVISLVLFWLPLLGPLLAGFVGGRTAGTPGRGFMAAILPAIVLSVMLLAIGTALTGLPVIGAIASISLFLVIFVQAIPLIIGAVVGGATA
ncbi:MAG: hypothetical protein PF501_12540 [Salinisphaera sp.]|nr:hypothetical protein [Salinisphaera sp.]